MKIFRYISWTVALAIFVWLIYPTKDIVSPDWDVLVTDMQDQPIAGADVSDFSQQYTVESHDTEEDAKTGVDGRVHFHLRTIRASGFRRLIGGIGSLQEGAHASFGVHTYVHASKAGYGDPMKLSDFAEDERQSRANGKPYQFSHLRLLKCVPDYGGMGCTFPDDPSKPILPFKP